MSALLLDITGGKATFLHPQTDKTVVSVSQEAGEVMERCAALRALEKAQGPRKPRTFRQVAEVPTALAELLAAQGMDIVNDREALRKFLNDPAFKAFRTSEGRV